MDSIKGIGEYYAYFWYKDEITSIINIPNININNKNQKEIERKNFIKTYDNNGKIIIPIWETSGRNFDKKQ